MLLGKKHSKPQQQHSCRECQMEYMLEDVATINQRLRLLDEMYSQKKQHKIKKSEAASLSKKIRDIDQRVGRFTRKLQSNSQETEELVTQTRLMLQVRGVRQSLRPSERLSLSPELMPLSNNFSSINSLNRYISHQNSTNSAQKSSNLNFSDDSQDQELRQLTDKFNDLMQKLQNDRSLSDTHLREQLMEVASRIKMKKHRILREYGR